MAKILLVEDDKSLREIYGVRLLAEGYDIVSAGDGEEALAMAIKDRPDLILSDVMMPKISGFDMLDILRSTTETKGIKVIMMTALSSEDQRQRGVALGADRYLVKSQVGIEDVVRTVHEVLADAPVTAAAPLSTAPSVASVPPAPTAPAAPVTAGPGARPSSPTTSPMPTPLASPVPAAPTSGISTTTTLPPSVQPPKDNGLPQPTAPFSTPRPGTLAGRVIEPIQQSGGTSPDFSNMMNQELSQTSPSPSSGMPALQPSAVAASVPSAPAGPLPAPVAPAMPVAPAPTAPASSGLNFEETPRPAAPTVPTPQPQLTTPPVPQPPTAPSAGV
jgi:CheY-like chemotaxis protein